MKKTLIALALAGATFAAAGGAVADSGKFEARMSPVASSYVKPNKFVAPRICMWPRFNMRWEYAKLSYAGFSKIKFVKKTTFLPRCAKFYYFTACKGIYRYTVIVRFIKFKRYVIVLKNGYCSRIIYPGAIKS